MNEMVKIVFVALIVLFVSKTEAIYECCTGVNTYTISRFCADNSSMNLKCDKKHVAVLMSEDELPSSYLFLENRTLIDITNSEKPVRIEYCQMNSEDSDVGNTTAPLQVLFCYDPSNFEESFSFRKLKYQSVVICISAAFVILTMLVYSLLPHLLDLQGKCTMHFLAGLACSYILLGIINLYTEYMNDAVCNTLPHLMYFSFFYMFFWLTTLSFHIWRITVKPHLAEKTVAWPIVYHVVAIGGAVTALVIIISANHSSWVIWDTIRPGFGETSCWFVSRRVIWIYFYGPLTILLAINIFFYLWTLTYTWNNVGSTTNKKFKYRLKLCIRLCVIMGITWCFDVFTFALDSSEGTITSEVLIFIVDLLNALQGFSIFLVLVVFRKSVRRGLATKNICNIRFPSSWKYLEDEEMESVEEKANGTIITYEKDVNSQEDVQLNT